METEIVDEGRSRLLRAAAPEGDFSLYELRMIMNNQPEGLLRMHMEEGPEGRYFQYYISGLESLQEMTRHEGTDYLYSLVFSLDRLADVMYEYMLSPGGLLLSPETIFLKRETGRVYFAYYPGKTESFGESLKGLMEFFLKLMNPVEEREILLLYGLYKRSREENVTLSSLADFWKECERRDRGNDAFSKRELPDPEDPVRDPYFRSEYPGGPGVADNGREKGPYAEAPAEKASAVFGKMSGGQESGSGLNHVRGILNELNIQLPPKERAFLAWKGKQSAEAGIDEETETYGEEVMQVSSKEKSNDRGTAVRIRIYLIILAAILIFYILSRS